MASSREDGEGGVPEVTTRLFGRDRELTELLGLLRAGDGMPVIVTGPGGVGKTRLAIEAAGRLQDDLPDGAAFVRLAEIRDPSLVADQVGRALQLASDPGNDPADWVVAALRHHHMLLVLDNFEQVVAAAHFVVALAARCPKLVVLVTSRRRLDTVGEHVIELGPLDVPARPNPGAPARPDIAGAASVALFCERAAAVSSRFEPDAATLDAIGEICRRLEGLPLAIELVAAYARQHSSQDLLARLDDRMAPGAFERVDGDAGGEVARHRDLTTAIRFSYDLLDDTPRRLLRRLSVFDGGWSVDALDAVCGDGDRPGVLLDALSELTDLHLAEPATAVHGRTRSRLLESVRTFAADELAWSGEAAVIAARHAEFFVDLAVEAALGLESRRARQWSEKIDEELANLRAAMDHLASTGRSVDALRAAAGLGRYWLVRGPATEGLRRLDQYLHRSGPSGETANGEAWAGRLAFELFDAGAPGLGGDDPVARIDRARDALSASGDEWAYLRATVHLSYSLRVRGELVPAEEMADDGLERCTTPETLWWEAELLNQRSLAVRGRDHERAVLLADRAIEAARASGHERGLTDATFTRLLLDMDRGLATASAVEHLYDQCGEIGNTRVQSIVAMCAGALAARDGDPSAARWYLRAIDIGRETGYDRATWWAMSGVVIALASARPSDSAGLHGSLHARADELLPLTSPGHRAAYERAVSTLRHSLEPVEFARLVRAGEQLPWDEAVDAARQLASDVAAESEPVPVTTDRARRRHRRRGPRANPELTERELEILAELVRGHTNQHIADDLGISPKTVMHHTTSVYRKLTVRGRAEAVAHALRSGLVTT